MKPSLLLTQFVMVTTLLAQNADKTFILVHGAWSSSHCWYKVTPLLESKGYNVRVINLPGYGADTMSQDRIKLYDYVARVTQAAATVNGKVTLVGAIISQAAETPGPQKVERLVFVDAFLLKNGESIFMQVEKINASTSSEALKKKHIATDFLTMSPDGIIATVAPERMVEIFRHDVPLMTRHT